MNMLKHKFSTTSICQFLYLKSKSIISFSEIVNAQAILNNFYLHQSVPMLPPDPSHVYRLIMSPSLTQKDMQLSINSLKQNKMMNELIQLQSDLKYKLKASRIIIDSEVQVNSPNLQNVSKNMVQLQKLFQTGLGLNLSYMISKKSLNQEWVKSLSKKRKAIHSNVVETGKSFQETVYDNGYQVEHIFLNGYKDKQQINSLQQTNSYNPSQLVTVLNMINFKGKIVLPQINFMNNVQFMQKILKSNGYEKRSRKDLGEDNWIAML